MRGVSWNLYDRLTDAIGERSSVRIAFDGKDVEINEGEAFPIPDLMIEIVISPPKIDRSEIYRKLRAPEVWKFSDNAVSIEQLDASGNYVAADASRFLFVRAEEVTQWLRDGKSAVRTVWKWNIREWAIAELRARAGI
jgi:hypothetical protein